MNEKMPFNEETIIHFALRYALPRQSTASSIVSEYIKSHLTGIDPRTLVMMGQEIESAINQGNAGASIDVAIWRSLAADIDSFLQKL